MNDLLSRDQAISLAEAMRANLIEYLMNLPEEFYEIVSREEPSKKDCLQTASITKFLREKCPLEKKRAEMTIQKLKEYGILVAPIYLGRSYEVVGQRPFYKVHKEVVQRLVNNNTFPLVIPVRQRPSPTPKKIETKPPVTIPAVHESFEASFFGTSFLAVLMDQAKIQGLQASLRKRATQSHTVDPLC